MQTLELSSIASSSNSVGFQFVGIFRGKESEIRITPDNKVTVYDFIKVAGGQSDVYKTWDRIKENRGSEILSFCQDYKFGSKKPTPVISAQGLVKLLMWLPGERAKLFRAACAEIIVRYLGGDVTLIDEIKAIDQFHTENPENPAAFFRNDETVQRNLQFSQDQKNISRGLVNHFADEFDTMYGLLFYRDGILIQKVGCAPLRKFLPRHNDHENGKSGLIEKSGEICYNFIFKMKDVFRVESEFKASAFYQLNSIELPKIKGEGNITELFKLSNTLTSEMIKQEVIKSAGDRIIDPPSYASITYDSDTLSLEKEKTKQMEIKIVNETKQKEMEMKMEMKKMEMTIRLAELEIKKLQILQNVKMDSPHIEVELNRIKSDDKESELKELIETKIDEDNADESEEIKSEEAEVPSESDDEVDEDETEEIIEIEAELSSEEIEDAEKIIEVEAELSSEEIEETEEIIEIEAELSSEEIEGAEKIIEIKASEEIEEIEEIIESNSDHNLDIQEFLKDRIVPSKKDSVSLWAVADNYYKKRAGFKYNNTMKTEISFYIQKTFFTSKEDAAFQKWHIDKLNYHTTCSGWKNFQFIPQVLLKESDYAVFRKEVYSRFVSEKLLKHDDKVLHLEELLNSLWQFIKSNNLNTWRFKNDMFDEVKKQSRNFSKYDNSKGYSRNFSQDLRKIMSESGFKKTDRKSICSGWYAEFS